MSTVNTTEERLELTLIDKASAVMKQVQGAVGTFRTELESVQGALGALGVTVGLGAVLELHRQILSANAGLDDMQRSTGASVEGLSALQRVAKVGGHDFEGLTSQIGRMIKGLKDGDEEGSKAAYALDFLGVKAKDANGRFRDTSVIITEVAQKLAGYADDGNKVQLIQDILGKGAERYASLLDDVAKGTDHHATVTREQAAQANEAEKNIRRLMLVMEDMRRMTVNGATPAIVEFTEKLLLAQKATGGLISGLELMARAQTENMTQRLGEIRAQLASAEQADEKLADRQKYLSDRFGAEGLVQAQGVGRAALGMRISRLRQEEDYLQRVLAARRRADLEDMEEDASGNLQPKQRGSSGYATPSAGGGRKLSDADRIEIARITDEEHFREQQAKDSAAMQQYAVELRIKAINDEEEMFAKAAQYRQKIDEEEEARANELAARNKERGRQEIELILQAQMTEEQVLNARYDAKAALLKAAIVDEYSYANASMNLEKERQKKLTELHDRETQHRWGITKVYRELDLESAESFFSGMSVLMNTSNRKMFEVGKAAAIADTIVQTYRAAQGAYASLASIPYVGPALGAAAAAAAIVAGIARVRAIENTHFGGGTSGAVATYSASPATGLPESAPGPANRPSQTTVIHIEGSGELISRKQLKQLVEQLNENARDGGRIVIA